MFKHWFHRYSALLALILLTPFAQAASHVLLTTSLGEIEIELNTEKAPISAQNFANYVTLGFYNGTVFHRVIPGFMAQGGGFTAAMEQKKPQDPIKNEADNGLLNQRGTIAMARTSEVNSATSQFFINVVDNSMLNHSAQNFGYAVFGKVIKGMDVVDKIVQVKTHSLGPFQDVPVEPITIISAKLMK